MADNKSLIPHHPYMDLSASRPVVLVEPNALPGSQKQSAAGNNQGEGGPYQACLGVGRRVPLAVAEFPPIRGDPVQGQAHVMGDVGVGVFVYRYCRSGMGHKDHANALGYA